MQYNLELNEEQMQTVQKALDLYARLAIGQWNMIGEAFLDIEDDCCAEKKKRLDAGMAKLRKIIFPDLPEDMGASYGVRAVPKACDAWEIYTVLRHCQAWARNPEGGWTVDYDKPMSFSGKPLAKCTAVKSTEEKG